VATSLAIFWGQEMVGPGAIAGHEDFSAPGLSPDAALQALTRASDKLTADFGTWRIPWGQINRYQRLTGDIVQRFDDAKPSTPVGFTSSTWGSLAAFGAKAYPGTKKWYGFKGNSFVAVVEFGDKVKARAVTAGGESGHPQSRHFSDQVDRYCTGNLRDVYFYPEQLKGHTERTYHPGGL
jgi:acyl-homoserine lactone acylase PvdQ